MEASQFTEMLVKGFNAMKAQGTFCMGTQAIKQCSYLSDTGKSCPVGHMMPDAATRRLAEDWPSSSSIRHLQESEFEWAQQFTPEQIDVLEYIQRQHDKHGYNSDEFELFMSNFAQKIAIQ